MTTPKYDVVLYGATGFTGSLAAQYLAAHPQKPRVAFAGRNEAKIRNVIEKLTDVTKERVESIGVITASADNMDSIHAMVKQTRALINMVGPYALYKGYEVAQACAEAGTHYVDLTGESSVYVHVATGLHEAAKRTGAIIVPSSGFDSMPFDLSTYLAVQALREATGGVADVDYALCGYHIDGNLSGGTVASLVGQARREPIGFRDAYELGPIRGTQVAKVVRQRKMPQFNKYGAFTLFTPHNTGVTNRSWGLLQQSDDPRKYGQQFRYLEGFITPGALSAFFMSSMMVFFAWMVNNVSLFGTLLTKLIPAGSGPSMERQLKGFADIRTVAFSRDQKTLGLAKFGVKGDPGYLRTAMFISEAGLTLALEHPQLPPLAQQGGVLTPATLGGEVLAQRLSKYGGVEIMTKSVPAGTDLVKAFEA